MSSLRAGQRPKASVSVKFLRAFVRDSIERNKLILHSYQGTSVVVLDKKSSEYWEVKKCKNELLKIPPHKLIEKRIEQWDIEDVFKFVIAPILSTKETFLEYLSTNHPKKVSSNKYNYVFAPRRGSSFFGLLDACGKNSFIGLDLLDRLKYCHEGTKLVDICEVINSFKTQSFYGDINQKDKTWTLREVYQISCSTNLKLLQVHDLEARIKMLATTTRSDTEDEEEFSKLHDREVLNRNAAILLGKLLAQSYKKQKEISLNAAGANFLENGQVDMAVLIFERLLAVVKKSRRKRQKKTRLVAALQNLAMAHEHQGNYSDAEVHYGDIIKLVQAHRKAETHTSLGKVKLKQGNSKLARHHFQQALGIQESQPEQDAAMLASSWTHIAKTSSCNDEVLSCHMQALALKTHALGATHPDIGVIHNDIGETYFRKQEFTEALKHYEAAMKVWGTLHTSARPKKHVSETLYSLAELKFHIKNPEDAIKLFQRSQVLYREIGDYRNCAECNNTLGVMRSKLNQYNEALNNFRTALRLARGEKELAARILQNTGNMLCRQGKVQQATSVYREALELKLSRQDELGIAVTLNNLAVALKRSGDITSAIDCYEQSLHIKREKLGHDHPLVVDTLENLTILHKTTQNCVKAHNIQTQVVNIRATKLGGTHPRTRQSMNLLYQVEKQNPLVTVA